MRKLLLLLALISIAFFEPEWIFAQSNYVLPYPSFLPGSSFYRPRLLFEIVSRYWYFGNLSSFKYYLKLSDKYLVDSKILFEYKQYSYAVKSLGKSDDFFEKALPALIAAQREGKDVKNQRALLREAAQKHIEVLSAMEKGLPETILWTPEKERSTKLDLKKIVDDAIIKREKYL